MQPLFSEKCWRKPFRTGVLKTRREGLEDRVWATAAPPEASGGELQAFSPPQIDPFADEFREDCCFVRIREKLRQRVAQGERDDTLGGCNSDPDCTQP